MRWTYTERWGLLLSLSLIFSAVLLEETEWSEYELEAASAREMYEYYYEAWGWLENMAFVNLLEEGGWYADGSEDDGFHTRKLLQLAKPQPMMNNRMSVQPVNADDLKWMSGTRVTPTCWVPAGRNTCAPEYIVAGTMKSGTTSLFTYLLKHPKILPLDPLATLNGNPILAQKEVRFFIEPLFSQLVRRDGHEKALERYLNVFPKIYPSDGTITGEASPMYVCQHDAAKRMHMMLPSAKVIIMLREPVSRCWSEYWFKKSLSPIDSKIPPSDEDQRVFYQCFLMEKEALQFCGVQNWLYTLSAEHNRDIEACLMQVHARIVTSSMSKTDLCGSGSPFPISCAANMRTRHGCAPMTIKNSLYVMQIVRYLEEFPSSQLKILFSENFYGDTSGVMEEVLDFLNVESEGFSWDFTGKAYNIQSGTKNLGIGEGSASEQGEGKYPSLDPQTRREMEAFFSEYNDMLFNVLGMRNLWNY